MNRQRAMDLLKTMNSIIHRVPGNAGNPAAAAASAVSHPAFTSRMAGDAAANLNFNPNVPDYAVEMSSSTLRFGPGVTQEIGLDLQNLDCKKAVVFTDPCLEKLPPFQTTIKSIEAAGVPYKAYTTVRCEPTDVSVKNAIEFAKAEEADVYVAVGGGSVIDTCKIANLYDCHRESDFLDFVAQPIGKGQIPFNKLKPLIAIPTTAGTGSETTGTAVFDFEDIKAKTGIQFRALRPYLGLVDPDHLSYMPRSVAAYSGLDVLCHGIESYTNIPFNTRRPRPLNPKFRPAYQGSNPISDVWSATAVRVCNQYIRRSFNDAHDEEASSNMHLASAFAGVGFGNAGVHLCHGLSYAISGQVKTHKVAGYPDHPLIPHGLSVIISAPAVFQATAASDPDRHLYMAECLGADISNAKQADAGVILADKLRGLMRDLKVENGLKELGYTYSDIPQLVTSTMPQDRVLALSPIGKQREDIARIFEQSLSVY